MALHEQPTARRVPHRSSKKYDALLQAAEERFGTLGFKGTSVDEIATAADVSRPLVYRYFASKEALFEAVVSGVLGRWMHNTDVTAALAVPSAHHRLRLVLRASMSFARDNPMLRVLLDRENQLLLSEYSDVLERSVGHLTSVITAVLDEGVRERSIREDIDLDQLAIFLVEVCIAFSNRVLSGVDRDADTMIDTAVEVALHGVAATRG